MMVRYKYDAFMSHNSADKPAVECIAAALEAQALSCFLDKWDILPRDQWVRNLETGITESRTILIFVGIHGVGPYQQAEADAALRRQIQQREDCVIPILLPGASPEDIAKLSLFLQGTNALRFNDLNDPLPHRILVALIRRGEPSNLRQLIRENAHAPADLLQTLNHWLSGLNIEWRKEEEEYQVSEGQGKSCLRIPDLSESPNPDSIEYLLNWKSRLTPLLGRESELKTLHGWADTKAKISIRLIIGEGGVGKTRLAFEFATQLVEKDWQAGEAYGLEGCWYTGISGTLLIIDYPEQRPEKITALLEALAVMSPPERKLRILLLGRNADFLQKLPQTAQSLVASHIDLRGLPSDDLASWELFQQAWRRLHELKHVSHPRLPITQEAFQQWRRRADLHSRPLFILALTIRLMIDPGAKELGGKEIIRVLTQQYEVLRLKKEAKKQNIDEYSLVMLRALAAISGQIEHRALDQLIKSSEKLELKLPKMRQIKRTSLWRQNAIHPLQPDLLAADLLHCALTELSEKHSGQWQYLALEAAEDIAEASSILGRLIHDAQSGLGRRWPLSSLAEWTCEDLERCKKLNPVLSRDSLEHTLLPLVIAVEKVLLAHDGSPQAQGHHLNNLSIHLADSGDRKEALQAIRQAVEIYKRLATGNFAAYAPSLAGSLNNLSTRLCESGEREEALQAVREGVEIYERLAEDNFATYGSSLATSLNNLSLRLANNGERKEALQASRRAMEIYKQLAADNIPVYGPAFAGSLNNMSLHLTDNGEREAALQAIQRAVETYEQLAAVNVAAYGGALAASLNNLSLSLADNGERKASSQAMQRAVEIYQQLAADNFLAYGPDLAMSLNNLSVDLANNGKREAGLQAIRTAVEIYEQLAADNFTAHAPNLAMSLNNLAIDLANNRKREESLQTFRRALEIREQLAIGSFATYGPALVISLHNFSIRLDELGKVEEAAQTKAKLESIKQRFREEGVHVPARLAFLFE